MDQQKDSDTPSRKQRIMSEEQILKRPPQVQRIEELMRSGKLVLHGFLGEDRRSLYDIIEQDVSDLWHRGCSLKRLASRMSELTDAAAPALGNPIKVEDRFEVVVDDYAGSNVCPWPHSGSYGKRITTVKRLDTGEEVRWTDLGLHMIREHGFFQGRGSNFRLEPGQLMRIIFP